LKKKEIVLFYQFRFPKKPGHSDFAQSIPIIFHCALDFFGRMPKRERCFLLGFSLAIFQKNEHPRGLGEWKIPQLNFRSASAVALAFLGRVRWRGAILHNKLIVSRPRGSRA